MLFIERCPRWSRRKNITTGLMARFVSFGQNDRIGEQDGTFIGASKGMENMLPTTYGLSL